MLLLQEKLNSYLAFLEAGEIYSTYPLAKGREFVIDVICRHRPDPAAEAFLARARSQIEAAGFGFRFGPLPNGYLMMPPNHALNRTRRVRCFFVRASVAAGRLA